MIVPADMVSVVDASIRQEGLSGGFMVDDPDFLIDLAAGVLSVEMQGEPIIVPANADFVDWKSADLANGVVVHLQTLMQTDWEETIVKATQACGFTLVESSRVLLFEQSWIRYCFVPQVIHRDMRRGVPR